MKKEKQKEFFTCLRLSRDDITAIGYDGSELTDEEMQNFADKIGESCTGEAGTFWIMLEDLCENLPEINNGQRE